MSVTIEEWDHRVGIEVRPKVLIGMADTNTPDCCPAVACLRRKTSSLHVSSTLLRTNPDSGTNLKQCKHAHGPIQIRARVAPLKSNNVPVRAHVGTRSRLVCHSSVYCLNEPTMHHVVRTVFYLRSGVFDEKRVSIPRQERLATRSLDLFTSLNACIYTLLMSKQNYNNIGLSGSLIVRNPALNTNRALQSNKRLFQI